ncbi:hypothetical protein AB0H34_11455 [Saccharopolyspora shandongensis]|uniref:hypothetical protein n=1 Tax=Saccharopolyspora shandongensis TaxID=418495 RepID=UPI0033E24393
MSAVSDLDQLLGHIIVKLTKALENLTTAQNALDESEQALSVARHERPRSA